MTLGGQQVTLRPLTTGEFLELIYMSTDVLHDALMVWANKGGGTYSFVAPLVSKLDKEQALQLICLFLHVTPGWLEENDVYANEAYAALKEAVRLNDWSEILQAMVVLDTINIEEVLELCRSGLSNGALKAKKS